LTPLRGSATDKGHLAPQRIAELERKVGQQELDLDFSASLAACEGKTAGARRAWRAAVYEAIQAMSLSQSMMPIERMCRLARVSRAGYCRFWQASAPRQHDAQVRDAIQRIALANSRHRGYRYITHQLRRDLGVVVNHKCVRRLMREDNLLCPRQRSFVPHTTDSRHRWRIVPNLARGLQLSAPDQLWMADITYIRLQEEFAYLAVVLDAYSRFVVGWAMADHLRAGLALAALTMVIEQRQPVRQRQGREHHEDTQGPNRSMARSIAIITRRPATLAPSSSRSTTPSACTPPSAIDRQPSSKPGITSRCRAWAPRRAATGSAAPTPDRPLDQPFEGADQPPSTVRIFTVSTQGRTPDSENRKMPF
jgi:hypothetical protein